MEEAKYVIEVLNNPVIHCYSLGFLTGNRTHGR